MMAFGGWGIRYGYTPRNSKLNKDKSICSRTSGGTWAYNAANGPYIEFTIRDDASDRSTPGRHYRIVSTDVNRVEAMLLGEEYVASASTSSGVSSAEPSDVKTEKTPLMQAARAIVSQSKTPTDQELSMDV